MIPRATPVVLGNQPGVWLLRLVGLRGGSRQMDTTDRIRPRSVGGIPVIDLREFSTG